MDRILLFANWPNAAYLASFNNPAYCAVAVRVNLRLPNPHERQPTGSLNLPLASRVLRVPFRPVPMVPVDLH